MAGNAFNYGAGFNEDREAGEIFKKAMEAEAAFLQKVQQGEEARRRQLLLEERFTRQMKEAADATERLTVSLAGVGRAFSSLAGGNVVGSLVSGLRSFGAMGTGNLAQAAGPAAVAVESLATAARQAYNVLHKFGSAGALGMGKTVNESLELLISSLGMQLAPALSLVAVGAVFLAGVIGDLAKQMGPGGGLTANFETFGEALTGLMMGPLAQFHEAVYELAKWISSKLGIDVAKAEENAGGKLTPAAMAARAISTSMPGVKGEFDSRLAGAIRAVMGSMQVNAGMAQPRFEAVTEAYRRVQMAEAGMTDIRRKILDNQRAGFEKVQQYLGGILEKLEGGKKKVAAPGD